MVPRNFIQDRFTSPLKMCTSHRASVGDSDERRSDIKCDCRFYYFFFCFWLIKYHHSIHQRKTCWSFHHKPVSSGHQKWWKQDRSASLIKTFFSCWKLKRKIFIEFWKRRSETSIKISCLSDFQPKSIKRHKYTKLFGFSMPPEPNELLILCVMHPSISIEALLVAAGGPRTRAFTLFYIVLL